MLKKNVHQFKKIISNALVLLLVASQILVLNLAWHKLMNYVEKRQMIAINSPETSPRYGTIFDEKPTNSRNIHVLFGNACLNLFSWSLGKEMLGEDDLKTASCLFTNCVFTRDRNFLENVHDFDAILFNVWCSNLDLPLTRTPRQHYIMAANE